MTNQDYITVKTEGFFIGGQPTTQWRGHDILDKHMVPADFNWCVEDTKQSRDITLIEYRVLQSNTESPLKLVSDNDPLPATDGIWGWVQAVFEDAGGEQHTTKWCCFKKYETPEECENNIVFECGWQFSGDGDNSLRTALFGPRIQEAQE